MLPLGQAAVVREGSDVTLVALSLTVGMSLAAAEQLAGDGISAEVIDLRTLVPLDATAVLGSARRTGRVVVVEENPGQLGWGAGIAAILAEEAFDDLVAPVVRVTGGNIPLPVAAPLEAAVSTSVARVAAAVRRQLAAPARARRRGDAPGLTRRPRHGGPRPHPVPPQVPPGGSAGAGTGDRQDPRRLPGVEPVPPAGPPPSR